VASPDRGVVLTKLRQVWRRVLRDESFRSRVEFLKEIFLFEDLNARAVALIAAKAMEKSYRAGEAIFQEGDVGRACFIVAEGRVEIVRSESAGERLLAAMEPGDFFGEMTLLDELPRSASARAAEPSRLYIQDPAGRPGPGVAARGGGPAPQPGPAPLRAAPPAEPAGRRRLHPQRHPFRPRPMTTAPVPRPAAPEEVRIFRGLFLFGLLVSAGFLAYAVRGVLLPFFLAGLLAYVMSPLVTFLELRGLRRSTSVAVLYATVIALAALLGWWAFSVWGKELPRLRYQGPVYIQQLKASAVQGDAWLSGEWPFLSDHLSLAETLDNVLDRFKASRSSATHYLPAVAAVALNLILVPFVGFFLLKGGRRGFQAMLDACPGRWVEKFLSLLYKVDDVIGGYLRGVLMEALLVGTCAGLGLLIIGVDYAGTLGAATVALNVVPYFGPMLAGALAVTAAFLEFGTFLPVAQTALLFLSLRLLDDFVFQPLVMNRAVHLHPAVVVFSLLAGHQVGGLWGLILAVPAVSILKESSGVWIQWYLSEVGRPSLPPSLSRAVAKPWVV
jgi:predicted PurR-regulated permease PerM